MFWGFVEVILYSFSAVMVEYTKEYDSVTLLIGSRCTTSKFVKVYNLTKTYSLVKTTAIQRLTT